MWSSVAAFKERGRGMSIGESIGRGGEVDKAQVETGGVFILRDLCQVSGDSSLVTIEGNQRETICGWRVGRLVVAEST